jgi:hypothetical protein
VDNIRRCVSLNRYDGVLMGFGFSEALARRAWGGRAIGINQSCVRRAGTGRTAYGARHFTVVFLHLRRTSTHGASPMRRCKRLQPRTPHPAPLALLKPTLDRLPSLLACRVRMGFTFVRRRLAGEEGNNATYFHSLLPFHSHLTRAPLAVCARPFPPPPRSRPFPPSVRAPTPLR